VVLTVGRWAPVRGMLAEIAAAVNAVQPGGYVEVEVKASE